MTAYTAYIEADASANGLPRVGSMCESASRHSRNTRRAGPLIHPSVRFFRQVQGLVLAQFHTGIQRNIRTEHHALGSELPNKRWDVHDCCQRRFQSNIRALLGCDQGLRTVHARTGMGQNHAQLRIGFGHGNGKGRKCTRHAVSGMDDYRNVQFDGGLKCFLGLRSQRAGAMHRQFPTPQNKPADRGNPATIAVAGFFLFSDWMEHG